MEVSAPVLQRGNKSISAHIHVSLIGTWQAACHTHQRVTLSRDLGGGGGIAEWHSSIALVLHGSEGEIKLTEGVSITTGTAEDPEIALFLAGLGKILAPEGRIDVLGCDVAGNSEGRELIAKLESLYSVNIAASDDITTAQKGGDMVLETDGINLAAVYFDEQKLKEWEGELFIPGSSCGPFGRCVDGPCKCDGSCCCGLC